MGKTKEQCLSIISDNFSKIENKKKIEEKIELLEESICAITGGEVASVIAYNAKTDKVKSLDFKNKYTLQESVLKDVIVSKRVFFDNHVLSHKHYNKLMDNPKNIKLKSTLIFPISYGEEVIGCLSAYGSVEHAYDFQRYDTRCISFLEKQVQEILLSLFEERGEVAPQKKKVEAKKSVKKEVVPPLKKEKIKKSITKIVSEEKNESQIKELEQRLKQKEEEIQGLNRALEAQKIIEVELEEEEELVTPQHELQTIVNFLTNEISYLSHNQHLVHLMLEMIKNSFHDEGQLEYIEHQLRDANFLESLADKLYTEGKIVHQVKQFKSFDEFVSIANLYEHSFACENIQYNIFIDPLLPLTLMADIQIIESILVHLLNNAKMLIADVGTIELLIFFSQESKELECTICAKNRKEEKRFFGLFKKKKTSNSLTGNQTGVGLSISSNLLRIIGGRLKLMTQEDDVHCFAASIPVEVNDEERYKVAAFKAKKPMKIAILLNEKDSDAYINLRRYFTSFGIDDANVSIFYNYKKMNSQNFSHLFCFDEMVSTKIDFSRFPSVTILHYVEDEMNEEESQFNRIYLNGYYGMTLQEILFPDTALEIKSKNILIKEPHLLHA
jgi:signal transduction histidine kinase